MISFLFTLITLPLLLLGLILGLYHLLYLSCFVVEQFFQKKQAVDGSKVSRFALIVPAHNEEMLIEETIKSILAIDYPKDSFDIYVLADNCTDKTIPIVKPYDVKVMERHDEVNRGKGQALHWFFRQIDLDEYDGYIIIDADARVSPVLLRSFNSSLLKGERIIQGYNGTGNRTDSWLTELYFISDYLQFRIKYRARSKLGFGVPMLGMGMCLSKAVIQKYGWTAFSITENWEYLFQLLENNEKITYNDAAEVTSQQVKKISQGVTQKERWFKGRAEVLKRYGKPVFLKAFKTGAFRTCELILDFLLPSLSEQGFFFSLLAGAVFFTGNPSLQFLVFVIFVIEIVYFLTGFFMSKPTLQTVLAVLRAPLFILWRTGMALVTKVSGVSEGKWIRTKRH